MQVPIPTGTKYRTTVTGSEIREVKCEKCGCEYVYIVQARATGSGFSPLFLDDERAHARAGARAKRGMQQQLRKLHLPIPCPDCGWYQKHMVELLRKKRLFFWMCLMVPGEILDMSSLRRLDRTPSFARQYHAHEHPIYRHPESP